MALSIQFWFDVTWEIILLSTFNLEIVYLSLIMHLILTCMYIYYLFTKLLVVALKRNAPLSSRSGLQKANPPPLFPCSPQSLGCCGLERGRWQSTWALSLTFILWGDRSEEKHFHDDGRILCADHGNYRCMDMHASLGFKWNHRWCSVCRQFSYQFHVFFFLPAQEVMNCESNPKVGFDRRTLRTYSGTFMQVKSS